MQTVDNDAWLSKADAASVLGVSVRQLELKTAQGLIRKETLPKKPNERAARVVYSREDLEAIKAGKPNTHGPNGYINHGCRCEACLQSSAPLPKGAFNGLGLTAAETERQIKARLTAARDPFAGLAAHLAQLGTFAAQYAKPDPKPFLTLDEAAEWSGLPAGWLLARARAGAPFAVNSATSGTKARWRFSRRLLAEVA